MKRSLICGLFFLTNLFESVAIDVWLTSVYNTNPWPGSESAPYCAGDAAAFTDILATNQDVTFHYYPGVYETYGYQSSDRVTAKAGCRHLGAGRDETIIRLAPGTPASRRIIFSLDYNQYADGFEVRDMTLDCNATNNPAFVNHLGACEAISIHGSNITISNLTIIGFGTGKSGIESFPISILTEGYDGRTQTENVIVEKCLFTSPAPGNSDGLSCCFIAGVLPINFAIRYCEVKNVNNSGFTYTHAFCAPVVENCTIDGCQEGVYFEPDARNLHQYDYIIRNNVFTNVDRGVFVRYIDQAARIKSLTISGNLFAMNCSTDYSTSAAFLEDAPVAGDGGIGLLLVRDNVVQYSGCSHASSYGFFFSRVNGDLSVFNNQIQVGNANALVIDPSLVKLKWIAQNYDSLGGLLSAKDTVSNSSVSQFDLTFGAGLVTTGRVVANELVISGNSTAVLTNVMLIRSFIDFPTVAANAIYTTNIDCEGVKPGDILMLSLADGVASQMGLGRDFVPWVSGADVIKLRFLNNNPNIINLPAASFSLKVEQYK